MNTFWYEILGHHAGHLLNSPLASCVKEVVGSDRREGGDACCDKDDPTAVGHVWDSFLKLYVSQPSRRAVSHPRQCTAWHIPDGEIATSRAAARAGIAMCLSAWATKPLEEVISVCDHGESKIPYAI